MPPVVGAAAVAGGAALAGSALSARAESTDKALAFQREQEAQKRAQYDQAMKAYEAKWNAWQSGRNALLQRYGIDIAPPATPAAAVAPGMRSTGTLAPGTTPTDPQAAAAAPIRGANLGGIIKPEGEWNDWTRYGLGAPTA
jgi:hypothetical protein